MRRDLDHLPARKQRDLARLTEILHTEFTDALALATVKWKRKGRIVRIVLYGSYARGTWVDELTEGGGGYRSDYDLLVIVNHEKLTETVPYWDKVEDYWYRISPTNPPIGLIVHTMDDINSQLKEGRYFFKDVVKEGIALYEMPGAKPFATPQPLNAQEAHAMALEYYEQWLPSAQQFIELANDASKRDFRNKAAFLLHQATEHAYTCLLLVLTNYMPKSHNIKFLRGLCEQADNCLIAAWPREQRRDKRCFELLKRAYVEARYSKHYVITGEELDWLSARVTHLLALTETVCQARSVELKTNIKTAE